MGDVGAGAGPRYPRAQVVAYELSPLPYLFARLLVAAARAPNLTVHRADFRDVPLDDASIVVCYLFPRGMERLRDKFAAELRPGALVVSNTFAVPGWTPAATRQADDLYRSTVYLYEM